MKIFDELKPLEKQIEIAENHLNKMMRNRLEWANKNRKEIKKLYPKKNKIYKINDVKKYNKIYSYSYPLDENKDWYFKAIKTSFYPSTDFQGFYKGNERPTAEGEILDDKFISTKKNFWDNKKIYITLLDVKPFVKKNKRTNVYVMIDKNTGFYKIGRSVNPKVREKTLQSEKPTIEMLFFYEANNKDEIKLHEIFKDKRIRGEWFDLNGSDLAFIKKYFITKQ